MFKIWRSASIQESWSSNLANEPGAGKSYDKSVSLGVQFSRPSDCRLLAAFLM